MAQSKQKKQCHLSDLLSLFNHGIAFFFFHFFHFFFEFLLIYNETRESGSKNNVKHILLQWVGWFPEIICLLYNHPPALFLLNYPSTLDLLIRTGRFFPILVVLAVFWGCVQTFRWYPDAKAASHLRQGSKKYLTRSTSNSKKCSWSWFYVSLPNYTLLLSVTNENIHPKSPPSSCHLLNTGNLRWDVGKESEMTCSPLWALEGGDGSKWRPFQRVRCKWRC